MRIWQILIALFIFSGPSFGAENPFQEFVHHNTIETNILKITPTYTVHELHMLSDFSKDDPYSAIGSDLTKSLKLPSIKNELGRTEFCQWLFDKGYNTNHNLPFLFTARLKETNEIVGFYTYFPYLSDEQTGESSVEQRTLIGLDYRNKGLGTNLRQAMIGHFKQHIYGNDFYLLHIQHHKDQPFTKFKILSLIAVVELLNFPSLVSNLKVPFQLVRHDGNEYTPPSCVFFSYPAPTKLLLTELDLIYREISENPNFEGRDTSPAIIKYGLEKIHQYLSQ